MRTSGVGVAEGVKVGRGVAGWVTPGGSVRLSVMVGVSGEEPEQLERRSAMPRPKSTHLVFMEMLITRDGRGVNVVYF